MFSEIYIRIGKISHTITQCQIKKYKDVLSEFQSFIDRVLKEEELENKLKVAKTN